MKPLTLRVLAVGAVILLISATASLAALDGPGDIAFVGWNADDNDDFAFVALVNIAAGEKIRFTDKEWQGSSFTPGEGDMTWTAPIGGVPRGTVVTINSLKSSPTASTGSIAGVFPALGNSNEALWALLGTVASPTAFLTVFSSDGSASLITLSGTGLTAGVTAIDFDLTAAEDDDVFEYTGPRVGESDYSDYLPLINDPNNWVTQGGSGDQSTDGTAPDLPFDTTPFVATVPVELMTFSID